jgi:hypothetical protein
MRRLLAVLVLPAVLLGAVALHGAHSAKAGEHFLWRVAGETNSVYLLGSIHALRPSDYPLADVIGEAFRDAEALVLEIRLPPGGTGTVAAAMGGTPGTRLVDQLSPEQYRRARELARAQGIDLASLSDLDPWLAGLVIMQGSLRRAGYRPGTGIDAHFQRKAVAAGKPILSLETARDQLQLFDALPREMQGDFLIRTLQEAAGLEDSLAKLVTAWKAGDVATVRDLVLAEFEPYPDLYERLVVQRNRNWLPQLESFLDDRRDYLVVVGAAHMLGEQGLVRMLERRGYHVVQR